MANVLAVFAHPDDEVLGCGGTLAKHAEAGDVVYIASLADCGRWDQFEKAIGILGAGCGPLGGGEEDQRFDTVPLTALISFCEVVGRGEDREGPMVWSRDHNPDIIYTHHPKDLNLDHALTARAVLTAFRPKPGEKPRTILACEVLSSTEYTYPPAFQPNWYVSLSGEQLEKKVQALECYESEIQAWPHPRSKLGVRNLAAYRGQSVGVEAAEAFQLLRGGPF